MGVVFVALRLHTYWLDADISRVKPLAWTLIATLTLIYGSANLLLALAWWHLIRNLGALATRLSAIRIYGVSQLARYLPGNIFHLAGRQALGMAAGMPAGVLAKSAIWELGSIAIAGSLFGWLILPRVSPGFPEATSVFLLLGSFALVMGILRNIAGRQSVCSFAWQMLFLVVSGTVFLALLILVSDGDGLAARHWQTIVGAYIVAWLVGLVTPGAPAGVGVRELILLLLLKGLVAEVDLLMAVLLGRLVTVGGDILFFVATASISAKYCDLNSSNA